MDAEEEMEAKPVALASGEEQGAGVLVAIRDRVPRGGEGV